MLLIKDKDNIITHISSHSIEFLKQKARKLKRNQATTHVQALDEIAKSHGFNHWHHVTVANKNMMPAETALSSGCVVAFDIKDGLEVNTSDGLIIQDPALSPLTYNILFEVYVNSPDVGDRHHPMNENPPEVERQTIFSEEHDQYMFFRLNPLIIDKSIEEILGIIKEHSFFMPYIIWLQGEMTDLSDITTDDCVRI